MERRLAAILAADVVGYSRLMGEDEETTVRRLRAYRDVIDALIADHSGRVFGSAGDSVIAEFASPVDALRCAVEIQRSLKESNAELSEEQRMLFRIGINLGDVMVEGRNLLGDGVNVAARLESLAEPAGICISRPVRDQIRDKLDLVMDDLGEVEVKNIARPVRAFRVLTEPGAEAPTRKRSAARRRPAVLAVVAIVTAAVGAVVWWQPWTREADRVLIERPSDLPAIAVLPFDNMSGDPDQAYFSDGITEDLITDLSRISGLFVIARTTVFTYKGKSVTVRQVGDELGVHYVLEGSVRRAGSRIRINAQLVDARTGRHLWADRYDREITDVFALQDEVTQKIVSALAVKLTHDEEKRLRRTAKIDPEAYDVFLRGLEQYQRYTRETHAEAHQLFKRATELDPSFARAYAGLALTHMYDYIEGSTDSPERSIQWSLEMAEHALALDDTVPQVHFAASNVYLRLGRHEDAVVAARRAIELDPNYADGYVQMAFSLNYSGRPEEALEQMASAMRLNPWHPFYYTWILGHAHFLLGRYEEAVPFFEKVIESNPQFQDGHLALATTYGLLGRIDDAEWEAEEILTLQPGFRLADELRWTPYKKRADLERWIEGLRKAGLPE
jgi:TolB-like protein/class 3 adenylate cyclase